MKTFHKAIIGTLFILSLLSIYYGAYRPFVKSQMYLRAQRAAMLVHNTDEVERIFSEVFDYASPIGEEEIVKFSLEFVQNAMYAPDASEEAILDLLQYVEERIDERDIIHLVQMGNAYDALWRNTGNEKYFTRAEEYYKKVLAAGPRLPQGLYSMFNLYGAAGMADELRAIAKRILAIWPEDERVQKVLKTIESGI
ncbi:hypothetical protein A2110_02930 [Candidatus Jorgensenbacteria bacterium GWA1_54_12]|uniref:Tetratricopeptide repeat-like domain-containing protein n=1 Tax=Candidatus Jorgensenbacteria bacterium GWA1_54_12 TaxID=1798468 RepID=A0A1F6BL70_9BACT|nr:MAG: hypothetical protein A2110_02930 [Candidatus Jorgensenbacteria bacterium GWA1_54_12]